MLGALVSPPINLSIEHYFRIQAAEGMPPQAQRRPVTMAYAGPIFRGAGMGLNLGDSRLLVVEDVALSRSVLCDMLEDLGLRADAAATGESAVDMAGKAEYGLILMNVKMAGIDGAAATASIRKLAGYGDIPIIGMTGGDHGDRERCLTAGMTEFIVKPIRADILLALIERWLGSKAQKRPTSAPSVDAPASAPPVSTFAVEVLLEQLNGNRAAARRLSCTFRDTFGGAGGDLARLVDLDGLNKARELAHVLKGVAGQLAAKPLFKAVGELEAALRRLPELVENATASLHEALGDIEKLHMAIEAASNGPSAADPVGADIPRPEAPQALTGALRDTLSAMIGKAPR